MKERFVVAPEATSAVEVLGWHSVGCVFAAEGGELRAQSGTSSTVRLDVPGNPGVYLKRYVYPRWHLRHVVKESRPRREWRGMRILGDLGVPTAAPVAWGEERSGGRLRRGFVATFEVVGAEDLLAHLSRTDARDHVAAAGEVGRAVADLHAKRFRHGDLYARNLLLTPDGRVHFIDMPRGTVKRFARPPFAVDLAMLVGDLVRHGWEGASRAALDGYCAAFPGCSRARLDRRIARAEATLAGRARRKARRRARRQ